MTNNRIKEAEEAASNKLKDAANRNYPSKKHVDFENSDAENKRHFIAGGNWVIKNILPTYLAACEKCEGERDEYNNAIRVLVEQNAELIRKNRVLELDQITNKSCPNCGCSI